MRPSAALLGVDKIEGHEAMYYELEGLDAHGGAIFYGDEVLGIVKMF